jgi:hypothetical protein
MEDIGVPQSHTTLVRFVIEENGDLQYETK